MPARRMARWHGPPLPCPGRPSAASVPAQARRVCWFARSVGRDIQVEQRCAVDRRPNRFAAPASGGKVTRRERRLSDARLAALRGPCGRSATATAAHRPGARRPASPVCHPACPPDGDSLGEFAQINGYQRRHRIGARLGQVRRAAYPQPDSPAVPPQRARQTRALAGSVLRASSQRRFKAAPHLRDDLVRSPMTASVAREAAREDLCRTFKVRHHSLPSRTQSGLLHVPTPERGRATMKNIARRRWIAAV